MSLLLRMLTLDCYGSVSSLVCVVAPSARSIPSNSPNSPADSLQAYYSPRTHRSHRGAFGPYPSADVRSISAWRRCLVVRPGDALGPVRAVELGVVESRCSRLDTIQPPNDDTPDNVHATMQSPVDPTLLVDGPRRCGDAAVDSEPLNEDASAELELDTLLAVSRMRAMRPDQQWTRNKKHGTH
jgi:hypothetical protein